MDYKTLTPAVQTLLTAHPDWTDQQVADALNAETVQPPYVPVFGNWRTLAVICTADEYNALRTVVVGVAQQEAAANPRGYLINDMAAMLAVPGDAVGTGGGLDLGVPQFAGQLAALCSLSPALAAVPGKVAGYVAGLQPAPQAKWEFISGGNVAYARTYEPGMG